MSDQSSEAGLEARLRRAGYHLPAAAWADLAEGEALLRAMLARIAAPAPEAEPATVFRAAPRA